jgi:hypothetical protein
MSGKKDEKTVENPIPPADSLIKPGTGIGVELNEDTLDNVAGGINKKNPESNDYYIKNKF